MIIEAVETSNASSSQHDCIRGRRVKGCFWQGLVYRGLSRAGAGMRALLYDDVPTPTRLAPTAEGGAGEETPSGCR